LRRRTGARSDQAKRGRHGAARERWKIGLAIIATFKVHANGRLLGGVRSFAIDIKAGQLRPPEQDFEWPVYRAYAGKAELRVGWRKVSKEENDYLSIRRPTSRSASRRTSPWRSSTRSTPGLLASQGQGGRRTGDGGLVDQPAHRSDGAGAVRDRP